jgi:transcriptional regulator with XRE-family HTH domain
METIIDRLKEIRRISGLNQTDFGKRIEIKQGTYSGIERGEEKLTERNKKLICLEFGINEEWLLNGKGEMLKSGELTHEEKELLEVFDKLEPNGKKEVQKYIDERLELQIFKKDQEKAFEQGLKGEK